MPAEGRFGQDPAAVASVGSVPASDGVLRLRHRTARPRRAGTGNHWVAMGLGLNVVAEGVETEGPRALLRFRVTSDPDDLRRIANFVERPFLAV